MNPGRPSAGPVLAALAGAALLVPLLAASASPAPDGGGDGAADGAGLAPLEDYEFQSCWGCHEAITDEWARSLHALAWERPAYQASLEGRRRPETCYGCHVPERLQSADLSRDPEPRAEELEPYHYGISCKSCHLAENGAMLGPIRDPVASDAHASEFSEGFTEEGSNALCIACHRTTVGPVIGIARDFELTAEAGASCVGCHMEQVERSVAIDDDDRPTPVRAGRRHLLNGPRDPAFLATAFELSVARAEDGLVLAIGNAAAHAVPGIDHRSFLFEAELLDADGAVVASASRVVDTAAPLEADGRVALRLPGAGLRVRVVGTHRADTLEAPARFLVRVLDVPR